VLGALAAGYSVLLVARVVTAVATGTFWAVAAAVVVSLVDPANRARALSLQMGGLTVANVLGVPLGTLVGQQFGWRSTFWVIGAAAATATVGIAVAVAGSTHRRAAPVSLRVELEAFTSGRLWLTLGIVAVFQTAVIGCFGYLAPLISEVGGRWIIEQRALSRPLQQTPRARTPSVRSAARNQGRELGLVRHVALVFVAGVEEGVEVLLRR
jgi:DHA1 family chloramphenicol resistance protein-like MFS transporter